MSEKQHYYLITTQVRYAKKNEEFSHNFSILTLGQHEYVTRRMLGRAQQASQMRLFNEVENPSPDTKVVDVVMISINYLGHMTEEEYNDGIESDAQANG